MSLPNWPYRYSATRPVVRSKFHLFRADGSTGPLTLTVVFPEVVCPDPVTYLERLQDVARTAARWHRGELIPQRSLPLSFKTGRPNSQMRSPPTLSEGWRQLSRMEGVGCEAVLYVSAGKVLSGCREGAQCQRRNGGATCTPGVETAQPGSRGGLRRTDIRQAL